MVIVFPIGPAIDAMSPAEKLAAAVSVVSGMLTLALPTVRLWRSRRDWGISKPPLTGSPPPNIASATIEVSCANGVLGRDLAPPVAIFGDG